MEESDGGVKCPACGNTHGPFKVRRRVMQWYTWRMFDGEQVGRTIPSVQEIEGEPVIIQCECGEEWEEATG